MLTTLFVVVAYLIGSLSFAVIVSQIMGLPSPHSYGSGNPGATNVLRSGSKKAAIFTLIGDAAKGGVALWLAQFVGTAIMAPEQPGELLLAAVALAAFLGHLYPLYFRFKGGKGVATAAGILLVMNPAMGTGALAAWLLVALLTGYSSLAALVAALSAVGVSVMIYGASWYTFSVSVMVVLLFWRHRGNITKLIAGSESRIRLGRNRDDGSSVNRG